MSDTADFTTEVSRIDAPWPQMIEVAKLMARAGIALPPHARENPSVCWAIMMQTREWHLSNPFFVAQHSYVVTQRGGVETLAYDSAVFQAVLLASKAIIGRPQYLYDGEDEERRCTVQVMDRQSKELQELRTPPLKKCRGHSPLWVSNPDQQLAYYGLRNLVRLKYQDVLGGFYDKDEYDDYPAEPSSPNLLERLPGRMEGDGFKPTHGEEAAQEQAALSQAKAEGEEKKARRKRRTKAEMAEAREADENARKPPPAKKDLEPQGSPLALPEDGSIPPFMKRENAPG